MEHEYDLRQPYLIMNLIRSGEITDVNSIIEAYNNKCSELSKKYGWNSQVFNNFKERYFDVFTKEFKKWSEE